MRLNEHDRMMAIARHPEYIKDYNEIKDLFYKCKRDKSNGSCVDTAIDRLRIKWNISTPILIPTQEDRQILFHQDEQDAIVELTDSEYDLRRPANALGINPEFPTRQYILLVHLEINLTKSEADLIRSFKSMIKSWKKNIPDDIAPRKSKYDPWKIYDLHQSNRSLNQIARDLCGDNSPRGERSPAYNDRLWPPYKAVERAYKKAVKMIQSVTYSSQKFK
ncbi:MAG TPA: hypothetical protein PK125_12145 [Syntrophorhabdus sp.]|nr:hypothetical protein [Syntrophorhabdus sp.]